jgi:uncharacterized membrane protein YfcA
VEDLAQFIAVGFIAQMVDGAIGMAYGLSASSILLSLGLPPVAVSASVHAAEVFTTGASALSHWRLGNVDRRIFGRLVVPGLIGGALGAALLSAVPGQWVRPFVSFYLVVMGVVILAKTFRPHAAQRQPSRRLRPLAFVGAVLDAVGGGGWGPIVTSSMIGWGVPPRLAVGTSNSAEFFITTVIAGVLLPHVTADTVTVVAGLVLGGVLAAPLAALLTRRLPVRLLMGLVGGTIVLISLNDLGRAWAAW